jgi:hypothetical protein
MAKTAVVMSLIIVCFAVSCSDYCPSTLSPVEVAIYRNSDIYQIPSSLLKGIRYAESYNGKWIWSDSHDVLIKQQWVRDYPGRRGLEKKYGRSIYWCIGQWQVQYLCARDYGYRGSPTMLTNIETNCKYASKILRHYMDQYKYLRNAISSYNRGFPDVDRNGEYYNKVYVDRVWKVYTNQMCGGWTP